MFKVLTAVKVLATAAIASLVALSAQATDCISDFSLVDHNGKFSQLSRHTDKKAVVLFAYDDTRDVRRMVG